MLEENFGINLTPEERNFVFNYCELVKEYGNPTDFPIPDKSKIIQYHKLMLVLSKLTPKELSQFNNLTDKIEFEEFVEKNPIDVDNTRKTI